MGYLQEQLISAREELSELELAIKEHPESAALVSGAKSVKDRIEVLEGLWYGKK